jgi:16S rRNA (guanine527-N7)-methyltransferase
MDMSLKNMLIEGASGFGVSLDESKINGFSLYKDMILEWNQKINLTAIEDERQIIVKHFIDSVSIMPFVKEVSTLVDVGTGAGFPGIPLKIAKPGLSILLMDSLGKRVGFLNEVISNLNLKGIRALHSRAEDAGRNHELRESFDAATARAVAALPVLLEYCLPLVKVGGVFIAMKGSDLSEAEQADKALDILGGKIEEVKEFILPFSDIKRNIIVVRKFRQTPTKYPRKAGKPTKEPLI